jgi:hypothetical protein
MSTHAATFNGVPIVTEKRSGQSIEYVQGQILVGLKPGATEFEFRSQLGKAGREVAQVGSNHGPFLLVISEPDALFSEIAAIKDLPSVRYAEPNAIHHLFLTPNDPMFGEQWNLNNTGQSPPGGTVDADMDCPVGWDFSTGSAAVKVGVLDTGIPIENGVLSHPDLDDTTRFSLGGNYVGGTLPVDGNGHGTHVSGTIGAESNNGIGVAGIAWQCQIRAIKVFDDNGHGTSLSFYQGVLDAVDNGCKVISYSGGGAYNSTLEAAVAYADSHDVVICAAAGNSRSYGIIYPAALSTTYGNLICVSATDHNDASPSYSSIGPEVTVAAPGGHGGAFDENDILSTFPNYVVTLNIEKGLPLNYAYLAGTSMACPHVAGLAALVLSTNPLLSADSVRQLIVNGADDLGTAGFDNYFGYGRINVYNTLLEIGDLNISHQPLSDTKETTQPYRVDCTIYSGTPLVSDSSLLHYRIDGGSWVTQLLTSSRSLGSYFGNVPAPVPGTTISYYLSARNSQGTHEETPIYSFKVIDYKVIFSPAEQAQSVISQGTVSYDFLVINDGIYSDQYSLSVSGNAWNTAIRDASTGNVITTTSVLAPNDSFAFRVAVIVSQSVYGVWDSVMVKNVSVAKPSVLASAKCITTSLGQPLSLPFSDQFPSTQVDIAKWVYNNVVEIDDDGLAESSAPYALHFDGYPNGSDTIVSQMVLLQAGSNVNLNYSFEQTGSGESPDVENDLCVDFLDADSNWVLLRTHSGTDPDMTVFEDVSVPLPTAALHPGFRLRFRSTGDLGHGDDWFVDNVRIAYSPQISVTVSSSLDATLAPPASADRSIVIGNSGTSDLAYRIEVLPQLGLLKTLESIRSAGVVEPASRSYPDDSEDAKSRNIVQIGHNVNGIAGGPDAFGYAWICSDAGGGPTFNWIDISGTGTVVSGLIDNSYAGPFPIGFDFSYYGQIYSSFYVSPDGFIGFGRPENYVMPFNKSMPLYKVPNNIIALLWDDLNLEDVNNPGGSIQYQTLDNKLIVQFTNVPNCLAEAGDVFTGEVVLYRDGGIRLQYLSFGSGFEKLGCSVGIENQDGLDGLGIVYCAPFLHAALCIDIAAPTVDWLVATPGSGAIATGESDVINLRYLSAGLVAGTHTAQINIFSSDAQPATDTLKTYTATLTVQAAYLFGDANGDTGIDLSDAVYLISYIFAGGAVPVPLTSGDVNCDTAIDISDVVYVLAYIFAGGLAPCQASEIGGK